MDRSAQIDRAAPTVEPAGRVPLLHQSWHHLLFLHWEVPAAALRPALPAGLELDTHDGRAFLGLVPFTITGTRASFTPPVPFLSSFHEVNLRTYVHRDGRDPGVWFFSLDASSAAAVAAARAFYHLPYHEAEIAFDAGGEPPLVDYRSRRLAGGAGCRARYAPRGPVEPAAWKSLEFFLVERYLLFAASGERLWSARVHHAPYPLQAARVERVEESLAAAAGLPPLVGTPLAHYARSVDVAIYAPEEVAPTTPV